MLIFKIKYIILEQKIYFIGAFIFLISILVFISIPRFHYEVYTNIETKKLDINDLSNSGSSLYVDIQSEGYEAIGVKIIPDIEIENNEKISEYYGNSQLLMNGLKESGISFDTYKYKKCFDGKCDINYDFEINSEIRNKFIDKYMYTDIESVGGDEMALNDIIMMNASIQESCFGENTNYEALPQCELKNIKPIFNNIILEITYFKNNEIVKTKTLSFN